MQQHLEVTFGFKENSAINIVIHKYTVFPKVSQVFDPIYLTYIIYNKEWYT